MKELIEEYLNYAKYFKTNKTYLYYLHISKLIDKMLKQTDLGDYNNYNMETLMKIIKYYKRETKFSNNTINKCLQFFYQILKHNEINHNLPARYNLPKDTKPTKPLKENDLQQFLKYIQKQESPYNLAMAIMLETGVRINELINIDFNNIDINRKSILLTKTKNSKLRTVFFSHLTLKFINQLNDNYFKNLTVPKINSFFKKVKRNTEIKELSAHRLRKTFATQLLRKGCPITTIQHLLGHSNISMTLIYLEINTNMLATDYFNYYPY